MANRAAREKVEASDIEVFFKPRSVAVIGASREPGKVGYDVVKNLVSAGFRGKVYPINPKADTILDMKAYPSVEDVPEEALDLAIIVIPSKFVLQAIDQCGAKGVKGVIIISAGFKEAGEAGAGLEKQLKQRCDLHGIRCIGPNCLGVIDTDSKLNASFAAAMPYAGHIAIFSQSGALGTAVLDITIGKEIGLSKFISYGNKADIDETTLMEHLGGDPNTRVILGYVESVNDGARFMRVARHVTRQKPVIILKSGRTAAGARAASSHTGSLAGSDQSYDCAFEQCGVLRAQTVQDLFDWSQALSLQPCPKGNRVAIVTNAGGPGIICTDAIERSMMTMATLDPRTIETLKPKLPAAANPNNPVDVLGDAGADRYEFALNTVVEDRNVDAILVIVTPQTSTEVEATAEAVGKLSQRTDKPILCIFMGIPAFKKGIEILKRYGVPEYDSPERGVSALEAMYRQLLWVTRKDGDGREFKVDKRRVQQTISRVRAEKRNSLGEQDARELVEAYGIRQPKSVLVGSAAEAVKAAASMGYPVVMKISSPDILHKSDVGGVRVGVKDAQAVAQAFEQIVASSRAAVPAADIKGVLVQEMISGGKEIILGMTRDPQFGPMIMFGLGGIYVEILKDVAFSIAPVSAHDAQRMISKIRAAKLLTGVRGEEPSDTDAIVDAIMRLSQLVTDFPALKEADLNPIKVFPKGNGLVAVDARFVIDA